MAPAALRPIDPGVGDTPAAKVARNLIDYLVVARGISPGEKLPSERELVETLGAGRSAVREALKTLNLLGLVEIRQGDGTYLRSGESELLPQVIEWGLLLGGRRTHEAVESRLVVECALAGFAAERRDERSLTRLDRCLAEMHDAVDRPDDFLAADVEFHLELARAADNAMLAGILANIQALLRVWIAKVLAHHERSRAALVDEHRRILDAVRAQDRTEAQAMMRAHLEAAGERLDRALELERLQAPPP